MFLFQLYFIWTSYLFWICFLLEESFSQALYFLNIKKTTFLFLLTYFSVMFLHKYPIIQTMSIIYLILVFKCNQNNFLEAISLLIINNSKPLLSYLIMLQAWSILQDLIIIYRIKAPLKLYIKALFFKFIINSKLSTYQNLI